jgi:hypothetical protein
VSQTLTLQLSDAAYLALQQQAAAAKISPENLAAVTLERQLGTPQRAAHEEAEQQAARERFERHFGEINVGHPAGADNDRIDADLASAYADHRKEATSEIPMGGYG